MNREQIIKALMDVYYFEEDQEVIDAKERLEAMTNEELDVEYRKQLKNYLEWKN